MLLKSIGHQESLSIGKVIASSNQAFPFPPLPHVATNCYMCPSSSYCPVLLCMSDHTGVLKSLRVCHSSSIVGKQQDGAMDSSQSRGNMRACVHGSGLLRSLWGGGREGGMGRDHLLPRKKQHLETGEWAPKFHPGLAVKGTPLEDAPVSTRHFFHEA